MDSLSSPVQLEDCLESFIKWENLDHKEMFNCKKCQNLQPADKKLDIWKLPPCLVRHDLVVSCQIFLTICSIVISSRYSI